MSALAKPHYSLHEGEFVPAARAATDDGFRSTGPDTAHKAASWYDRDTAAWRPRRGSADADLLPELDTMRGRSRDLGRNNGVAHGITQTIVDNVVGVGLRLSAKPDYRALGKDKAWADKWRANVQSRFQAYWCTTAIHSADTLNGDQLAALALRSQLENGDALGVLDWIPERGDGFATKVKTIESDRLSNPMGEMDSAVLRGGVKLDPATGAPIGYYIRNAHPGDAYMSGLVGQFPNWEYVSRRTSFGRLRVLHAFEADRSEQHRGKPLLASVLPMFKQISRYTGAELAAAVANAKVAGIITTPMSHEDILEMFKLPSGEFDVSRYLQMRDDHAVGLEDGSILPLAPGDDFKSHLPQRPATGFAAFVENILRMVGAAADLPYELVLKDFSKTNYSSARAALLEAWRSFLRRRDNLGTQWCDPIYHCWLEEQVNAGTVEAPDFYENRAAYQRCKWIGPGRGWVDPVKEAMASQIRIDAGISTLEDECAEQGKDWEENMEQRATELARAKELNIPQVVSGRATIVPEDASSAPGETTPGSAPSNGAPATGAESYNVRFDYRMEAPNAVRRVVDTGLNQRLASIETAVLAVANRPPTEAPKVDVKTGDTHVSFPEGAFHTTVSAPAVTVQLPDSMTLAAPEAPASGTPTKRVEKRVLERDAEGRILRTEEIEFIA